LAFYRNEANKPTDQNSTQSEIFAFAILGSGEPSYVSWHGRLGMGITPNEPVFRPSNPEQNVRVYVRHLPHWRQDGATYFVTFRQDDSIPANVLAEWQDLRKRWLQAHNLDLPQSTSNRELWAAAYRRIPVAVRRAFERQLARMLHEELDRCHGSCVLRHAEPRRILADALSFFHGDRLWMGDFVIMPNHAHGLMTPLAGWELEDVLESIKKWTSRRIGEWLDNRSSPPTVPQPKRAPFWQQESYDRIVRDREELFIFRRYIAQNPQHAALRASDFTYHAAEWLDPIARLSP
jgi:type I restriction enzyme R subunit